MNRQPREARTYRLSLATIALLDAAARATGVAHSVLVDALLEHTLSELAAGVLTIQTRPVAWDLESIHRR